MTDSASLLASVRTGTWRQGRLDRLRLLAIVSLVLDSVTTWHVLTSEEFVEYNAVIDGLWNASPLLGSAHFVGFYAILAVVCTRRLGWLSTTLAVYVSVVMGLFGGLNNLELFVRGAPSLIDVVAAGSAVPGAAVVGSLVPLVGSVVAVGTARLHHGRLPWHEVALVAGGLFVAGTAIRLSLHAVGLIGS